MCQIWYHVMCEFLQAFFHNLVILSVFAVQLSLLILSADTGHDPHYTYLNFVIGQSIFAQLLSRQVSIITYSHSYLKVNTSIDASLT